MKPRVKNFDIEISKLDLKKPDYEYFRDLFQMNCTKELFVKENIAQIRKNIEEALSEEYSKLFVIIIGRDPAYYLQAVNEGLFMFKVEGVAVFIYKTRYVEIPRYTFLEKFDKETMDMKKVEELKNLITLKTQKNLPQDSGSRIVERIREWIAFFFVKHSALEQSDLAQFEKDLLTKLRIFLLLVTSSAYWNLYLGNKIEYLVENGENEVLLLFEFDFPALKTQKHKNKKKLLVFQKKGVNLSFFNTLKWRTKEIFSFISMAVIFFTMVGCRGFDLEPSDEEKFQPVRNLVCPHKSNIIMLFGVFLFSIVFQRFFLRQMKNKKAKAAVKKNKKD